LNSFEGIKHFVNFNYFMFLIFLLIIINLNISWCKNSIKNFEKSRRDSSSN